MELTNKIRKTRSGPAIWRERLPLSLYDLHKVNKGSKLSHFAPSNMIISFISSFYGRGCLSTSYYYYSCYNYI